MRKIVTGHDASGRSVFVSDAEVQPLVPRSIPGYRSFELWQERGLASGPTASDSAITHYFPAAGECIFRVFEIPPADAPAPDLAAAAVELPRLLPGFLEHFELDHPGMHTTPSTDFVVLLCGEVVLELDDGQERRLRPGDVVIQNGTRHAWRNRSAAPARLAAVLLGRPVRP